MTREQFDKVYLDKVIHCDTEEKAKEFLALADSVGYRWVSSKSLLKKLAWDQYEKETCYEVKKFGLMFGSTESFSLEGAQIIEYKLEPKFKQGDKVRVKNTLYTTVNGKVGVIVDVDSLSSMPYLVKISDGWALWFYENQLEIVERAADKEDINGIIEELKENQKRTAALLNRLEQEMKNK